MQDSQDLDYYLISEVEKRPKLYNGHNFKTSEERLQIFQELAETLKTKYQVSSGKNSCISFQLNLVFGNFLPTHM